jgi:hypothetical protein
VTHFANKCSFFRSKLTASTPFSCKTVDLPSHFQPGNARIYYNALTLSRKSQTNIFALFQIPQRISSNQFTLFEQFALEIACVLLGRPGKAQTKIYLSV